MNPVQGGPLFHARRTDSTIRQLFVRVHARYAWIKQRTRKTLAPSSVYTLLGKAGGVLKVPRKTHAKKDAAQAETFKQDLPARLDAATTEAAGRKVRLWVLDEHRYGLLPMIRRCWELKRVWVHVPYATRYKWGYLHEAMEVDGENRLGLLFNAHHRPGRCS